MSHHFFLSYARADSGPLVRRLFDDLCDIIRTTLGLPRSKVVGFYEDIKHQPGTEWSLKSSEALQTSRSLVCLLSPNYFRSERAGQEWQIFEMRLRESMEKAGVREKAPERLPQIISPVSWIPWEGPVPTAINELLIHPDRIYQKQAVTMMFKPPEKSLSEYAAFVRTLAYQIIEMTEAVSLPPLESPPSRKEVHSSFQMWEDGATIFHDGTTTVPEAFRQAEGSQRFVREGELSWTPTQQSYQGGARVYPSPPVSVPDERSPPVRKAAGSSATDDYAGTLKPKVFIIDNDEHVRKLLVDSLPVSGFEVEGFSQAEDASAKAFGGDAPDLFVVDLTLNPARMSGLDFIKKLTDSATLFSSIIATSEIRHDLVEAIKAGAVGISKPPAHLKLIKMMRNLAGYGIKRRLYKPKEPAESSSSRPVFLSSSHENKRLATGLKSQLEAEGIRVWYAPHILNREEVWHPPVQANVDCAEIFLALVTKGYLRSNNCLGELERFSRRLKGDTADPMFLPVLWSSSGSSDELKNDPNIKEFLDGHDCPDLTGDRFLDGLHVLMGRIQERLFQS